MGSKIMAELEKPLSRRCCGKASSKSSGSQRCEDMAGKRSLFVIPARGGNPTCGHSSRVDFRFHGNRDEQNGDYANGSTIPRPQGELLDNLPGVLMLPLRNPVEYPSQDQSWSPFHSAASPRGTSQPFH